MGQRLDFLDGIRGWAALFVTLFHVFTVLPVTADSPDVVRKLLPFSGVYAVLTFFAVLGFSLSIGFLQRNDARTLLKIGTGRYFRLVIPILATCLAVHVLMVAGALSPDRRPPFDTHLAFEPSLGRAIKFALFDVFFDYTGEGTYAGPLWFMSVELIGSLILLVLLPLFPSTARRPMMLGVAAALILVLAPNETIRFYSLFFAGAALADAFHRGWLERIPASGVILLAGIAAPAVLPTAYDAWNVLGAMVLAAGCVAFLPARRALSSRLSTWLGEMSFPLYLAHGPVLVFFGEPTMRQWGEGPMSRLAIGVAIVALSFVAALPLVPVNRLAIRTSRTVGDFFSSRVARQRGA